MVFGLELRQNFQQFLLWPKHTWAILYSVFMWSSIVSIDNYKIKILISSKNVTERLGRWLIVKVLTIEVQGPESGLQLSQVAEAASGIPALQGGALQSKWAARGAMSLSFWFDWQTQPLQVRWTSYSYHQPRASTYAHMCTHTQLRAHINV